MSQSSFTRLRPHCVRIIQLLSGRAGKTIDWHALRGNLEVLKLDLDDIEVIDGVLTDYVLFPILQVFRTDSQTRPSSASSAALDCLGIVLGKCETNKIVQSDFSKQISRLVVNLLERQASLIAQKTADEAELSSLCVCVKQLALRGVISSPDKHPADTDAHFAIFATLLTILLKAIATPDISAARVTALEALDALILAENDGMFVRRFLPGILSSLVKPFSSWPSSKTPFRQLATTLDIIRHSIQRSFVSAILATDSILATTLPTTKEWLQVHGENLVSIFTHLCKVQDHARDEVRNALFRLCQSTLEAFESQRLSALTTILLRCLMDLQAHHAEKDDQSELFRMIIESESLQETCLAVLRVNMSRLPTELQSIEPKRHTTAITALGNSLRVILQIGTVDSDLIRMLADSFLASTSVVLQNAKPIKVVMSSSSDLASIDAEDSSTSASDDLLFGGDIQSQDDANALQSLFNVAMGAPLGTRLLQLLASRPLSNEMISIEDLSRMWISKVCMEQRIVSLAGRGHKLGWGGHLNNIMETSYNTALDILNQPPQDGNVSLRLQILALQLVEQRSLHDALSFRPELMYALYPVIEKVAASAGPIRSQAILTLKNISIACGYEGPGDLLLHNSDYLINAVSIRLNSFDLRPGSARVLQLAIKLCGPAFIPFIGDLVDSIFTILELYHGSPSLVQSMFAVLGSVIDEVLVESTFDWSPTHSLTDLTEEECARRISRTGEKDPRDVSSILQEPRRSLDNTVAPVSGARIATEPLIARVLRQGQFYLTYDAASVRQGLLQVLDGGFRALHGNEDTLLPVINDLWPVLIQRVYDPEPYIVKGALNVLETAIKCSGTFLLSRFEAEWPKLKLLFARHRPAARSVSHDVGVIGAKSFSQTAAIWTAVMSFAATFIQTMELPTEIEDDLFKTFGGCIQLTPDLERALLFLNEDALWLSKYLSERILTNNAA